MITWLHYGELRRSWAAQLVGREFPTQREVFALGNCECLLERCDFVAEIRDEQLIVDLRTVDHQKACR